LTKRKELSLLACLQANLSALAFDFVVRQKIGGTHLTFGIFNQLPVLPPATYAEPCAWAGQPAVTLRDWLLPRVLELTYTAWDLEPFARDCGWSGPPFVWDEARRFQLRCELDAVFLHLYGLSRADAAYILDTFPTVRRRDEAAHGTYRTRDTILALYDQFAEASTSGKPFVSPLDPPPAAKECRHPRKTIGILAFGSLITDPGKEIAARIAFRIKTETSFPVEYVRISKSKRRSGAPTLAPHSTGARVAAQILVLSDDIPVDEARNMLWHRETDNIGTGKPYPAGTTANSIVVQTLTDDACVENVHYTDFHPEGKTLLSAVALAKAAIESVPNADEGMDGITYLMGAMASRIETPLTKAYHDEILKQTDTHSLTEARDKARKTSLSAGIQQMS
jgi:hypothetical protein